jgi:hypothetical protein
VYVPIIKNGDTLLSGNLLFNIYVDSSGNVTSDAWKIAASNSKGAYALSSSGELTCDYTDGASYTTASSFGTIYYYNTALTYNFPIYFYSVHSVAPYGKGGYLPWFVLQEVDNDRLVGYCCASGPAGTCIPGYHVSGRWRS